MTRTILQIDSRDNVAVALEPLAARVVARVGALSFPVAEAIPAKHKMALTRLNPLDGIVLYGMTVGEAVETIEHGGLL